MTSRASVTRSKGGGKRRTLATRVDVLNESVNLHDTAIENLERRMASQERREKARDAEVAEKFAVLTERVSGMDSRLGLLVEKVGNIQSVTRDTWDCMDKIREGQEKGFSKVHERLNTLGCAPAADKEKINGV